MKWRSSSSVSVGVVALGVGIGAHGSLAAMRVGMPIAVAIVIGLFACKAPRDDAANASPAPAASTTTLPPRSDSCHADAKVLGGVVVDGLETLTHKPLVVSVETAIGDMPSFVMYEDGLILFRRRGSPLVVTEVAPLVVKSFAATLIRAGFDGLAASYECSPATDKPTLRVLVRGDAGWFMSAAYGVDRTSCALAPAALADACRRIATFDDPAATPFDAAALRVPEGDYIDRALSCLMARGRGESCAAK